MSSGKLKELLQEFGKLIGITDLAPDQDNYCCLSVDESIMIHIKLEESNDYVTFLTQVGRYDDMQKGALYPILLHANFNYVKEDISFTLAKAVGENTITLSYKEHIRDMEFPRFETIMKATIEASEEWVKKVEDCVKGLIGNSETSDTLPSQEQPHMMGMRV